MKFVTQKFSKKAISIILALSILLSAMAVGFGAFAEESETTDTAYTVNADVSPAIPMFAGTEVNLNNVKVLFAGDTEATSGADITWALEDDYSPNLVLANNVLTAHVKGNNYKITATAGDKSASLWVVVANEGDTAWNLYSIDFDADYTAAYSKLDYQANALTEAHQIIDPDGNVVNNKNTTTPTTTVCDTYIFSTGNTSNPYWVYVYQSGKWSYNGTEFTYNGSTGEGNVPSDIAFPTGWSSYISSPGSSGVSTLYKVPHVMPYDLSAGLNTNEEINAVTTARKGIMPFANPYLFDGYNMSEVGYKIFNTFSDTINGQRNDTKGYFVLNNEITEAFSDYTMNVNLDTEIHNCHDGKYNGAMGLSSSKSINFYGRMPVDANGKPTNSNTYSGTIKTYNSSGEVIDVTDAIKFQSISVCPFYIASYGGNPAGATVARLDFYNTNAQSYYATSYGSDPYSATDSAFNVTRWDYLKSRQYTVPANTVQSNTGVNVDVSIKYEGTTATLTSVNDETNTEIVFDDVYENKGAIAMGIDSISLSVTYDETTGSKNAPWMNVHQFSIDLVNDITAENDGSEYPVYEKHYYQPVVDDTLTEGYVDVAADEKYFVTLTEAIDYLDGKGGKVWIKGMYEGAGADFEGTIENRKPIILSGYGDSATTVVGEETVNNGLYNDTANTTAQAWAKGDITFQYMMIDNAFAGTSNGGIDSGRVNYNFGSGGYTFTFGYGLTTASTYSKDDIFVGVYPNSSAKDSNYNIYSGTYSSVAPFNTISVNSPVTMNINSNINIYGGTIRSMSVGSYGNIGNNGSTRVFTINGDVNYGIYGGKVNNFNLITQGYRSDIKVTGNVIVDISGGTVTSLLTQIDQGNTAAVVYQPGYQTVERGNMAVIVDGSNSTVKIGNVTSGIPNLEYLTMAENKYMIAIINNYTGTGATFDTAATYQDYEYYTYTDESTGTEKTALRKIGDAKSILDRWHYKITVKDGEARPYFVREDENDPSSSYLQGFTIVPNEEGLITAVNGEKIEPTGKKTEDGLDIYDLSAYMSDRADTSDDADIIAITFLDERTPVVSTDENFTPDATIYKKVATIDEAIALLGAEGGKIYIKGDYTITNMQSDFVSTQTVAAGNKIVIAGYGETSEGNTLYFGTADAYVDAKTAWMYCDVTFENLNLIRQKRYGQNTDFNSNGYVLTFGNGLTTDFVSFSVGQVVGGKTNHIVMNSGTYPHLIATTVNTSQYGTAGTNIIYTINGGTYTLGTDSQGANFMGGYDNGNYYDADTNIRTGKSSYINGDITWNIKGGEWSNKTLRTTGRGYAAFACYGTLRVNVAGGDLSNIEMHVGIENSSNSVDGPIVNKYNNMVVRVDHRYSDATINSQLTSVDETQTNDGKKYIAIANYAEDIYEIVNYEHGLDYSILVFGGEADAVFTGTGADAVFKGFTITPEKDGMKVLVNEKELTPDADGVYDLSEFEDTGSIHVRFEEETDYSEYVAFRNDFNNSYEKLNNADETVNVVFIGGSVTNGDGLELVTEGSWRARTAAWLESAFPSKVNATNSAISGTGTSLGIYRTAKDVIAKDPDILFIEFSINDSYDGLDYETAAQQFETMIREVKLNCPDCDIATVLVTDRGKVMDAKAGTLHEEAVAHDYIAEKYGIPAIYVGRALASHLEDGLEGTALETAWAEYVSDYVHPNDKGYAIYYSTVRTFLEGVYSGEYSADNKTVDVSDPSTIISDTLSDGNRTIIMGTQSTVTEQSHKAPVTSSATNLQTVLAASNENGGSGFSYNSDVKSSLINTAGVLQLASGTEGKLVYTFTGTELSIIANLSAGDVIYYTVDGGDPQSITRSGTKSPITLFKDIEAGEHTVEISFEFAADTLNLGAICTRDASKATGATTYELITNVSQYRGAEGYTAPTKAGYLFGGWYASEDATVAMTEAEVNAAATEGTPLYAKFVPSDVLKVGWQIAKTTDSNSTETDIRLISTVDSLQYSSVRFTLVAEGGINMTMDSTTVYSGIVAYTGAGESTITYKPIYFSAASYRFMTHTVTGVPSGYFGKTLTVQASWLTKDGTRVYGAEATIVINDALNAQ